MRLPLLFAVLFPLAACSAKHLAPVRHEPPPAPVVQHLEGPAGTLTVTRVGHAAVLLQSGEHAVLTDPWFTVTNAQRQGEPLAFGVEGLPPLTLAIASHGHYDHYDVEGLAPYPDKALPLLVRKETGGEARDLGFSNVRELDHWESAEIDGIKVTAAPAEHGEGENTYIIEMDGFTIFFGADTLRIPELDQIPGRFPSIDLALLSVNGLSVTFKGQVVMNAEEAAEVAGMTAARVAVPMHYHFRGSLFREVFLYSHRGTPEAFVAAAKTAAPNTAVYVLETGAPLRIERTPAVTAATPEEVPAPPGEAATAPGEAATAP